MPSVDVNSMALISSQTHDDVASLDPVDAHGNALGAELVDPFAAQAEERLVEKTAEGRFALSSERIARSLCWWRACGDGPRSEALALTLYERSLKTLRWHVRWFKRYPDLYQDAQADMRAKFFLALYDLSDPYYERNFRQWLDRLCVDGYRELRGRAGFSSESGRDDLAPLGRHFRRVPRSLQFSLDAPWKEEPAQDDVAPRSHFQVVQAEEEARRILLLVSDACDRQILQLHALHHHTFKEIGAELGLSAREAGRRFGAVCVRVAQRLALEEALEDLPAQDRRIVYLAWRGDGTWDAIGAAVGLPAGPDRGETCRWRYQSIQSQIAAERSMSEAAGAELWSAWPDGPDSELARQDAMVSREGDESTNWPKDELADNQPEGMTEQDRLTPYLPRLSEADRRLVQLRWAGPERTWDDIGEDLGEPSAPQRKEKLRRRYWKQMERLRRMASKQRGDLDAHHRPASLPLRDERTVDAPTPRDAFQAMLEQLYGPLVAQLPSNDDWTHAAAWEQWHAALDQFPALARGLARYLRAPDEQGDATASERRYERLG